MYPQCKKCFIGICEGSKETMARALIEHFDEHGAYTYDEVGKLIISLPIAPGCPKEVREGELSRLSDFIDGVFITYRILTERKR